MDESRQTVIITTNRKHYRKNNDYILSQLSHLIDCERKSKQEIKYSAHIFWNINYLVTYLRQFLKNRLSL